MLRGIVLNVVTPGALGFDFGLEFGGQIETRAAFAAAKRVHTPKAHEDISELPAFGAADLVRSATGAHGDRLLFQCIRRNGWRMFRWREAVWATVC